MDFHVEWDLTTINCSDTWLYYLCLEYSNWSDAVYSKHFLNYSNFYGHLYVHYYVRHLDYIPLTLNRIPITLILFILSSTVLLDMPFRWVRPTPLLNSYHCFFDDVLTYWRNWRWPSWSSSHFILDLRLEQTSFSRKISGYFDGNFFYSHQLVLGREAHHHLVQ